MENDKIKNIVKEHYKKIASQEKCGCSCGQSNEIKIAQEIGYTNEEIKSVPEANFGLGCGNPVALGKIKEGDVVLDLGSGAGFDCFLASKKVGETGQVIGVDMTQEMINKAEDIAEKHNYKNVRFVLGDIEDLPIKDDSVDIIISNCVINLAPNKEKVFKEAYRVLKNNGKMYVSDIVLLDDLTKEQRENDLLIASCVGGAVKKEEYIRIIQDIGFKINILSEDKDISKKQYQGMPLESLKIEAIKE